MKYESQMEKGEKPPFLYVSAQVKGIKELTPMSGKHRSGDEGAVIFSARDIATASIFLIEGHSDRWMQSGYFGNIPYVAICMDRDDFIKRDKGGVMYKVPSGTFDCDLNLGLGDKEWTSHEPVKPIEETVCPSALDTMIDNGVNVYFVNRETFEAMNGANDHGLSILLTLISENQRREKVIKPLQDESRNLL